MPLRIAWAASWALFSSKSIGTDNRVDPEFDLFKYIDDNGLQGREDEFIGSFNKTYADARLDDLRRKERNQETLGAAGWAGSQPSRKSRPTACRATRRGCGG